MSIDYHQGPAFNPRYNSPESVSNSEVVGSLRVGGSNLQVTSLGDLQDRSEGGVFFH